MKYLSVLTFLLLSMLISSCSDEKVTSEKQDNQTGVKTQFDAPNLLDLETNTSLPEKALGDD